MHSVGFYMAKTLSKILHKYEIEVNYYRWKGVTIGRDCLICTDLSLGSESKLLKIGNKVVVSTRVNFVLHDFSISRVIPGKSNLFGEIQIGDNCFIGTGSTIMYGVKLADNIIVAAGSVVTRSFYEEGIIIGGNPAKKIGTWKEFKNKYKENATSIGQYIDYVYKRPEMLVERR